MVQRVGIDNQPRKQFRERGQRRGICDVGRGEEKRGFLAVEIRKLGLKRFMIDRGAGNITGAARSGARGLKSVAHGAQNLRVLAHAQIIVAAPDRYRLLGTVLAPPRSMRELPALALNVDERPVAAFFVKPAQSLIKFLLI